MHGANQHTELPTNSRNPMSLDAEYDLTWVQASQGQQPFQIIQLLKHDSLLNILLVKPEAHID